MDVELVELAPADRPILANVVQFYKHDFSEFDHEDVGLDGRFGWNGWTNFFASPSHHVLLIRVDGEIAGFACASEDIGVTHPLERVWWMDEFFVLRKYRRRGVGKTVAHRVFDLMSGPWEVAQIRANTPAQAFWRSVVGEYTAGRFEEYDVDDDRWDGPVQYFRTS